MRARSRQGGVAAVEMALVLLPLVLIVFGITEFGRAFYEYNTVLKATRDAARYLTSQQAGGGSDAQAACLVRYGNPACMSNPAYTGALLAPGLATATITVCDWVRCPATNAAQGSNPVENLVTVTVSGYPFNTYVPLVIGSLSAITFSDIHTTMKANL